MKKIFFGISLLIAPTFLFAQITEGILIYETEIINNKKDWLSAIESVATDSSEIEEKDTLDLELAKKIAAFLEKNSKPDSTIVEFNRKYAVQNRSQRSQDGKLRIYEIATLVDRVYSLENNEITYDSLIWDYKVNPNWSVNYEVKEFTDNRDTILGFECYRVEVFENRVANGNPYQMKFELYVTDAIHLPPHFICGWYEMIIQSAALAYKAWDMRAPDLVSFGQAVYFSEGVDGGIFNPEILKND